jgi:hypothetical protein
MFGYQNNFTAVLKAQGLYVPDDTFSDEEQAKNNTSANTPTPRIPQAIVNAEETYRFKNDGQ